MEKSQLIKCHCVIDIIFKINIAQGANSKSKTLYFIYVALLILQQLQEMLKMVQFSSVALSCLTICDPIDCSTPGFPVHHQLPEPIQTHESVMSSNHPTTHLILWHPILLLPSIILSIRVFSNESVLHIRWPKYWSFSFSNSPPNE